MKSLVVIVLLFAFNSQAEPTLEERARHRLYEGGPDEVSLTVQDEAYFKQKPQAVQSRLPASFNEEELANEYEAPAQTE
jgi:hypothetical protein